MVPSTALVLMLVVAASLVTSMPLPTNIVRYPESIEIITPAIQEGPIFDVQKIKNTKQRDTNSKRFVAGSSIEVAQPSEALTYPGPRRFTERYIRRGLGIRQDSEVDENIEAGEDGEDVDTEGEDIDTEGEDGEDVDTEGEDGEDVDTEGEDGGDVDTEGDDSDDDFANGGGSGGFINDDQGVPSNGSDTNLDQVPPDTNGTAALLPVPDLTPAPTDAVDNNSTLAGPRLNSTEL